MPYLVGGYGKFLLGLRVHTKLNEVRTSYALGTVTVDSVAPAGAWLSPTDDLLVNPGNLTIQLRTQDTDSPVTVRVMLEGRDHAQISAWAEEIAAQVRRHLA